VQGRDRAEQLGAGDLRFERRVLDQGRRHVEAVLVLRIGEALAAGEHLRTGLLRPRDPGDHLLELTLVDHGAQVVLVVGPQALRARALEHQLDEPVVDLVEHDQPAARGATLAGIRVRGKGGGVGGRLEVRVVAHHERVLAAQLEAHLREPLARDAGDHPSHARRSRERDDGHVGMLDERLARLLAEAVHDVQHARRQPRLLRQPREHERGLGRVLGVLQDSRVAAHERREDLPRDVRDRRVRGDDQPGDAQRLAGDHRLAVWHRACRGLAVEAPALAGHEVAHLDRAARLAGRLLRGLAGLRCDHSGDLLLVALEQLGDPAQDRAALCRRLTRPGRLRALGGVDRGMDVVRRRARDHAEHLAGRRRHLLERGAARGWALLAVDEVRHRAGGGGGGDAHAVKPPSTRSS
jgi:hypothetical protein